jgi:acyl carrier protein
MGTPNSVEYPPDADSTCLSESVVVVDTPNSTLGSFAEILHSRAGVPPELVVPEATFADDLDVDSLTLLEVLVASEREFGIRIPDEVATKFKTVAEVIEYVDGIAAGSR